VVARRLAEQQRRRSDDSARRDPKGHRGDDAGKGNRDEDGTSGWGKQGSDSPPQF
jgi:hypothetical protein